MAKPGKRERNRLARHSQLITAAGTIVSEEGIDGLTMQEVAQRVAEFLLELAGCQDGRCDVTLPYDKVLIAGRLGMKPESLSRAFARLKPAGVTIRKNHARIEDVDRLRCYAEEDPAQAWSKPG